ncbi:MAG: glycosyltransferase family 2 protein [Desulfobacteraceae bacterium]|nr:MAG: glycosyltransferase family 2 protein [Desulfobacteraceae bacterium]
MFFETILMAEITIAILMTCHNRKNTTLSCLEALMNQEPNPGIRISVFLVDDGSEDGTADAVSEQFPHVKILYGNGSLYWGGGMRMAFDEASEHDYDFYIWLNDDVILYPYAISKMIDTFHSIKTKENKEAIIVGSTRDDSTGRHAYGGIVIPNWWPPLKLVPVIPADAPLSCDTMGGNLNLISRNIVKILGNLDPYFSHGTGDVDYGLRAGKAGISCRVAPGYLGHCPMNKIEGSVRDTSLPIHKRKELMSQRTSVTPIKERLYFTRRHTGYLWPIHWIMTITSRILFPRLWLIWRSKFGR